ncbi:MAG: DUF4033 domain-containing protein [bacterium]|nr:DUF4033 domain-containing protein [bacterium]
MSAESWFGRWQIGRLRRAYTAVSGWRSDRPGYAGFVAELQWGLEHLSVERRTEADDAVFRAVLFGRLMVWIFRTMGGWFPRSTTRLFALATPTAFSFLTGPIRHTGKRTLAVPECRFHREGGQALCHHVCRAPVHRHFDWMRVPLRMEPDAASLHCDWRYGPDDEGDKHDR